MTVKQTPRKSSVAGAWAVLVAALCAPGCGQFETRSIILDLRIMAVSVEPPEVVVPIDLESLPAAIEDPAALAEILADIELPDVQVCALVSDPADARALEFTMHACAPTEVKRCDRPERALAEIATGMVEDPEEAGQPVAICGTLSPSLTLFQVLQESFEVDPFGGLSGLKVQIQFTVRAAGAPFAEAEFAAKTMVFSVDYPAGKVANRNPTMDTLGREFADDQYAGMNRGRCADLAPFPLAPGETITLKPIEAEDAREDYVLATFDGGTRSFTENLTYSWYSTDGRWSQEVTGGPRDLAGNDPELESEWTAPEDVDGPLDVGMWVVQRDERGGLSWYESCVRVDPSMTP